MLKMLFYCESLPPNSLVKLPESESRHIIRVLRLTPGDSLEITDGKGNLFEAVIDSVSKTEVTVRLGKRYGDPLHHPYHLHIAIAPTKNSDRFEWFVEKATEIGIDRITPIICEHSERKTLRTDRLERVAIAAMKQSLKGWKPEISPVTSFGDFIALNQGETCFIAHCAEGDKSELAGQIGGERNYTILIGPEGDFSDEEIKYALGAGYRAVSLGSSRLRTETAGIVACHTVSLIVGK